MTSGLAAMTWSQWTLCAVMVACMIVSGLGVRYGLFASDARELAELEELKRLAAAAAERLLA